LENLKKNTIKLFSCIILIIPFFFGINADFLFIKESNISVILTLIFFPIILLFLGKIIELALFDEKSIDILKKHDVINSLINNNKSVLFFFFPITILMEELIFRYYLTGFLFYHLGSQLAILISSMIFSLYHIHIWFTFKNYKILISFLSYSFILGLYNGYIFLNIGIFPCIIVHYILVFIMYFDIYQKNFKINKK